ncbi:hypothetical protein AB5N19_06706 [Seiridium cardinale]|uniref:RING-type domain-containing protein n=1 Tax=Seiridium cardinale TaxID=138064 RepID=A0ABR2XL58_9PEZI
MDRLREPPISDTPTSSSRPSPAIAEASQAKVERCDICWQTRPSTEFIALPCKSRHRYMRTCITYWLAQQDEERRAPCQCPLCRQILRYSLCSPGCDNSLEIRRIGSDDTELLNFDLRYTPCLECRSASRAFRRSRYIQQVNSGDGTPVWTSLQPGDLIPQVLFELHTPSRLEEEFLQYQDEHEEIARIWRDEADQLARRNVHLLKEDNRHPNFAGLYIVYWKLRSMIDEYERVHTTELGINTREMLWPFDVIDEEDNNDDVEPNGSS